MREWGAGPCACVLIHGFGEGAYIWNDFASSIARLYRTLAVDLRGHGDSGWDPAGRYDVQDHVHDVLSMIEDANLKCVVLVGHSLGAEIAIRIAAARQARIVGTVIVDFGPNLNPEALDRVLADFNDSMRTYGSVSEYAAWLEERRPIAHPALLLNLAGAALRAQPTGGFRPKCDPAMGKARTVLRDGAVLWDLLRQISCPVLVVRGAASAALSRPVAERMASELHDGCLRTINAAGHEVMMDNPGEFAAVVYPFLCELRARDGVTQYQDR